MTDFVNTLRINYSGDQATSGLRALNQQIKAQQDAIRGLGTQSKLRNREVVSGLKAESTLLGDVRKSTQSFTSSLKAGVGQAASLATGMLGVSTAMEVVNKAGQLFVSQLQSAIQYQKQLISGTTALQNAIPGLDRNTARGLVQRGRTELSRANSKLGGFIDENIASSVLSDQLDDYLSVFKDRNKGVSEAALNAARTSFIIQNSGVDASQFQNAQRDFLSGNLKSLSAISQRDAFVDSGYAKALSREVQKSGIDLAKATLEQRIQLDVAAKAALASSDALKEYGATADASVARLKSSVFGNENGLLSFSRSLSDGKTFLDEFNRSVDILFGDKSILSTLSGVAPSSDVVENLRNTLRKTNDFLSATNSALQTIADIPGVKPFVNYMSSMLQSFTGLGLVFNSAAQTVAELTNYFNNVVNAAKASINIGSKAIGATASFATNPIGSIVDAGKSFLGIKSTAKYRGDFISAASGFYASTAFGGALQNEIKNKPPQSSLVIANSSEAVLTKSQLQNVRSANQAIGRASQGNSVSFSVDKVIIQTNTDRPSELADLVIRELDARLERRARTTYSFS